MISILQQHREFTAVVCNKLEQSVFSFQTTWDCMSPQLTSTSQIQNVKTCFFIYSVNCKKRVWCNLIQDSNQVFPDVGRALVKERAGELDWGYQSDQDPIISPLLHIFNQYQ